MRRISTTLFAVFLLALSLSGQEALKAGFTAQEAAKEIYRQGFDSIAELDGWQLLQTNAANTWKLANSKKFRLPDFSAVDPASRFSLSIFYDDAAPQHEVIISPYFKIDNPSFCKFYSAFDGVHVLFANFTISIEKQSDNQVKEVFNAFTWSQESGHERAKWLQFEIDLQQYVNESIRFIFTYSGQRGDDVYVDDFCLYEIDASEEAKVFINEGGEVHFMDRSTGNPSRYEWTFEGGIPETSTDKNPVVTYAEAGSYNVTLKAGSAGLSDEIIKTAFVNVQGLAPIAAFDFPEEGYLSPDAAVFIPQNTPVVFHDRSANLPDEWLWTLPGSDVGTSSEQNPVAVYPEIGRYAVSLTAGNAQGADQIDIRESVQVGDTCHIWNIAMEESQGIGEISLGLYGYYGGSNWLGMLSFAEKFKKPIVPAKIYAVDIYFSSVEIIEPPVDITVSVASVKDGMPGSILGSAALSTEELVCDPAKWLPTTFAFKQPIEVDTAFFVIVSGLPNRSGDDAAAEDKVVMGAVKRELAALRETTTYHLLEDVLNEFGGRPKWFRNEDENVSFALAPRMQYKNDTPPSGIAAAESEKPLLFVDNKTLVIAGAGGSCSVSIYNLQGIEIARHSSAAHRISMPYHSGIYIVQLNLEGKTYSYKVRL